MVSRIAHGHITDGSEVDFIARKPNNEQQYIQVTQSLSEESVYKRELAPLQQITDNFSKTILTYDGIQTGITAEGIRIVKLTDWLLESMEKDTGYSEELITD